MPDGARTAIRRAMKHALSVTRSENFAAWYQDVIAEAEMAEESGVRGCMVIKPWGYGIWERIQKLMDARIKAAGVENCYFPLFIPLSYFAKEAEHVDGFAKEMAVVTHHRLEPKPGGGLRPAGELDEQVVLGPVGGDDAGVEGPRPVEGVEGAERGDAPDDGPPVGRRLGKAGVVAPGAGGVELDQQGLASVCLRALDARDEVVEGDRSINWTLLASARSCEKSRRQSGRSFHYRGPAEQ